MRKSYHFTPGCFEIFVKNLKKYKRTKERLIFLSMSKQADQRLKRKLAILERRILALNAKWMTGIATATLLLWMSKPVQAQFAASFNLDTINGSNGFVINGIDNGDFSGSSVSGAGDFNGDGIPDIIIGAAGADPNGNGRAGETYVVFGDSTFTFDSLNLSDLNGSNSFVINGIDAGDDSGTSVDGAGDFNGDGIDDIIIGAPDAGECYVIFGSNNFINDSLNLVDLNGSNGFIINGINFNDGLGESVSGLGDVNGDGIDDIIIGAPSADPNVNNGAGESYVIFGDSTFTAPSLNLSDLNGANGFVINGIDANDNSGGSVSGAGDFNGDGIDDIIIGAYYATPNGGNSYAGESYVVFGSNNFIADSLNLSDLNGSNGFVINGIAASDYSGYSVSGAGDINGDGIDDIIIGAYYATPSGNNKAGESYVVFGSNSFTLDSLDLADLNGSNGFVINGIDDYDYSGVSVSGAGDINGDGIDDIIIGASSADPNGNDRAGESYVVFGKNNFTATSLNLVDLNGSNGFLINGIDANDLSGASVSGLGDVNGDGIDDIIIGAPFAYPNGVVQGGESYVIYGKVSTTAIDEQVNAINLKVYPNPTKGQFTVELMNNKAVQLEISNLMGQVVISKQIDSKATIDFSTKGKGIYFVNIITAAGEISVKKLVLQ